jgi:hypothetical protein
VSQQYALVLEPDMVGKRLKMPPGCRVLHRNESSQMIEDEGGPVVIIECDDALEDDDDFSPIDFPGVRLVEPL